MKTTSLRKVLTAILIICVAAGYAQADKQQLMEKLSGNVRIQIEDATITEALTKIGQAAEVKIVLSDEAIWKLPYGEATRLSVSLSGPLADSLTEMLNAFFMRYAVGEDEITVYPRQELEHILGRPSTEQLELLKNIYTCRIEFGGEVSEELLIRVIKGAFGEISFFPHYTLQKMFLILAQMGSDKGSLPVTLAVLLEQVGVVENMPRWYLTGVDFPNQIPAIRVVGEEDFREARLSQIVDISFKDEKADVILQRLAGWTGMELVVSKREPSWLDEEIISVNMQNITLRQAIRNIISTVNGIVSFYTRDNKIQVLGPERPRIQQSKAHTTKMTESTSEGYVGKISIPMDNGKYFLEFMLRESDLTEEFKQLRDEKISEIMGRSARIKKLRETLMELENQEEESQTK